MFNGSIKNNQRAGWELSVWSWETVDQLTR